MLQKCKHFNCKDCAICQDISDREVFKHVLKKLHPETFICKHARYKVTDKDGLALVLDSLEDVQRGKRSYFVVAQNTSEHIDLKKDNIEVLCAKQGECDVTEPYVAEYNPR